MSGLRGLFVWPPPQRAQGRGPWEQEPQGSYPPGRKWGPAGIGPKEAPQRGPLPALRGSPTGRHAGRQARALSEHASRAEFEKERDSRPLILPRPSPTTRFSRGTGGGSHSPISILVVDIEPLCGAEELWGLEQRCQGTRTHP